ncbi:MAG: tol-pal system protein YbgF [bacterium]
MNRMTSSATFALIMSSMAWMPAHALQPSEEALIELYQRVEELQKDVNKLRGDKEELQHHIDKLKKQQKEGFIDLDDRYESLNKKINSSATSTTTEKTASTATSATEAAKDTKTTSEASSTKAQPASAAKPTDEQAYREAYRLLKDDPYKAISAFQTFLKDHASSRLAANAEYWIGESYYSLEKYPEAKKRFLTVLKSYKGSSKEADAALKLGYTFYAMKEWKMARKTFEDVARFFPGGREADLAKDKLASLDKEGR